MNLPNVLASILSIIGGAIFLQWGIKSIIRKIINMSTNSGVVTFYGAKAVIFGILITIIGIGLFLIGLYYWIKF